MNRRFFILLHLYLSAFFTAAVVLMALSGGMYLLDIEGSMREVSVGSVPGGQNLQAATDKKAAVLAVLADAGIRDFDFDYVRGGGDVMYTRPTSRSHYRLDIEGDQVEITQRDPSLVAAMIELHKGHGPTAFRTFQKVLAAGLVFMILSGAWLGLSATRLRVQTAIAFTGGILVLGLLVMV